MQHWREIQKGSMLQYISIFLVLSLSSVRLGMRLFSDERFL